MTQNLASVNMKGLRSQQVWALAEWTLKPLYECCHCARGSFHLHSWLSGVGEWLVFCFFSAIALDLHKLIPGLWYLLMIGFFTGLSMAVIIHSKEAGVIVDENIQNWVAIHGALEIGLFTDNGLEFNKTFQEMAKKLDLSLKTTAAYST